MRRLCRCRKLILAWEAVKAIQSKCEEDFAVTKMYNTLATLDGQTIQDSDLLRSLHRRQLLQPLLRQYAVERAMLQQAAQAGLTVTAAELQQAADRFRARHGLHRAQDTQAWLDREGFSAQDFTAHLEEQLLLHKVGDHLAATHLQER